jgi:hypothetical protein
MLVHAHRTIFQRTPVRAHRPADHDMTSLSGIFCKLCWSWHERCELGLDSAKAFFSERNNGSILHLFMGCWDCWFSFVWLLGLLVLVIVCRIGSHWHARIHDTGYRYRFVRSLSLRGNRIVFCVLSPVKDLCLKAVQKRAFLSGKKV